MNLTAHVAPFKFIPKQYYLWWMEEEKKIYGTEGPLPENSLKNIGNSESRLCEHHD